jgi:hypothetical protein
MISSDTGFSRNGASGSGISVAGSQSGPALALRSAAIFPFELTLNFDRLFIFSPPRDLSAEASA